MASATAAMTATMMPYSTMVAPDSSFTKRRIVLVNIRNSLWLLVEDPGGGRGAARNADAPERSSDAGRERMSVCRERDLSAGPKMVRPALVRPGGRASSRGGSAQVSAQAADVPAAAQCVANAPARSAAISWALRPSICQRSSMNATSPSLSSAMLGELGA